MLKLCLSLAALAALTIPLADQPARIPLLLASGWLIAQIAILANTWKRPLRGRAINTAVIGVAVLTFAGSYAASAQALELGIQDDGRLRSHNQAALFNDGHQMGAQWLRIVTSIDEPWTAQKIRDAHASGYKVILTVGGNGTRSRKPSFRLALRYIQGLPRAERYTIDNEPDMDGIKPCTYRRGWMQARKVLGQSLLWGDLSPHRPARFTQAARACGPLPAHLNLAVHPYQWNDPLGLPDYAPWAEGGIGNLRNLKRATGAATLWLTEFAYTANLSDERAAWLWPRALQRARNVDAKVLVVYTAQGPSWDTRPRDLAWAAIRNAA
jgi:hypothetical protein